MTRLLSELDEATSPQEEAVRLQAQIEAMKLDLEVLTARRDEAIAKALEDGIKVYGGYRFSTRAPSSSLDEALLEHTHPDVATAYAKWYAQTREVKLTKTDLSKFLTVSGNTNPDQVLADCTVPGKGASTYAMTRIKEAGQ